MALLLSAWSILLELAPWLLVGATVAGVLHVLLPEGFVHRQLSGRAGVLKAVLLGIPLPLCSCSVIPTGIGLRRDGASRGASVGFLIATPQTGVDSIFVAAGMLGWPFALAKVGAALVTGVAGGWLVDLLPESPENLPDEMHAHSSGWWAGVEHGIDLIRMVWRWLVVGVLLSAAITVYLPPAALTSLAGEGLIAGFVVALLVSLPLYVCATASVPIAAALLHAGLPTGAAMVFLMAGPATNLATLGAVKRAFGMSVTLTYLGTLIVGSMGFGLLYEVAMGPASVALGEAHMHATPVAIASSVVLLAMLAWFAIEDLRGLVQPSGGVEIEVEGMTCGGCASRLERTLRAVPGVQAVSVSHEEKRARVQGSVQAEALCGVIAEAGFTPGTHRAVA